MSVVKLFADDTSVFNVVFDTDISAEVLNQDLRAVQDWAYPRVDRLRGDTCPYVCPQTGLN